MPNKDFKTTDMKNNTVLPLKHYRIIIVACVGLLGFSACNVNKNLTQTPEENIVKTPPTLKAEDFLNQQLLYKTFSGKGDAKMVTDDKSQNLGFQINMHKDQDALFSVRAMGILEVARAYATPDSIFALNRLNKTAYALGYQEGAKLLQADVPFLSLQNLITGAPLLPGNTPVTGMETKDSEVTITQKNSQFIQTTKYNLKTQALTELDLKATDRPFQCTINYDSYGKIGIGQPFAYSRRIQIKNNGKNIQLSLKFTQATIDYPVNTNFNIPGSYTIEKRFK